MKSIYSIFSNQFSFLQEEMQKFASHTKDLIYWFIKINLLHIPDMIIAHNSWTTPDFVGEFFCILLQICFKTAKVQMVVPIILSWCKLQLGFYRMFSINKLFHTKNTLSDNISFVDTIFYTSTCCLSSEYFQFGENFFPPSHLI